MRNHQDTNVVRATFREAVSGGALIVSAVSATHAVVLLYFGDANGWANMALSLGALALRPFFAQQRPFTVFLAAMFALVAAAAITTTALSTRYGPAAGFHLLLFGFAPLMITSGRIGPFVKWALVLALTGTVIGMDQMGVSPKGETLDLLSWHADAVALLRATNLAALGLMMPALANQYFQLVTKQQGKLLELALRDPLTGLFNRRHAHEMGATLLANISRGTQVLSVVLIDLDHFKAINDERGHDTGDLALKHVAALLGDEARASDIVCRWGGEEFLVLLPQTNLESALTFAERFRTRLSRTPLQADGRPLALTATIGVGAAGGTDSLDSVVDRADKALYEGKRGGRNCVVSAG